MIIGKMHIQRFTAISFSDAMAKHVMSKKSTEKRDKCDLHARMACYANGSWKFIKKIKHSTRGAANKSIYFSKDALYSQRFHNFTAKIEKCIFASFISTEAEFNFGILHAIFFLLFIHMLLIQTGIGVRRGKSKKDLKQ